MPILAKKIGGDFPPRDPIPQGTHIARCYQIIQIGTVTSSYEGKETQRERVRIGFELPNILREFKEGEGEKPMVISEEYTLSLSDNSNLGPLLVSWRGGKKFTKEEEEGFDIENLLGVPAILSIVHETKDGKTYANIGSITATMKGMDIPKQVNPSRILSYDSWNEELFESLPKFIKDKIISTPEYQVLRNGTVQSDEINIDDIDLADVPF